MQNKEEKRGEKKKGSPTLGDKGEEGRTPVVPFLAGIGEGEKRRKDPSLEHGAVGRINPKGKRGEKKGGETLLAGHKKGKKRGGKAAPNLVVGGQNVRGRRKLHC